MLARQQEISRLEADAFRPPLTILKDQMVKGRRDAEKSSRSRQPMNPLLTQAEGTSSEEETEESSSSACPPRQQGKKTTLAHRSSSKSALQSCRANVVSPSSLFSLLTDCLYLKLFQLSSKVLMRNDLIKPSRITDVIAFNLALSHHLMG